MTSLNDFEVKDLIPERPVNVTKDLIILCLKGLFARHGEFRWSPVPVESKVFISDAFPTDKEQTKLYPAVVTRRGAFQWRNRHLNQTAYNNMQGKMAKGDILYGQFDILCASPTGLEAERLAEEVFLLFTWFRDEISSKGLFDIRSIQLGTEEMVKAGSDTDIVIVPVRCQVEKSNFWQVTENAPTLEEILITVKP